MNLPELPNFNDATIEQVTLGLRRELTLTTKLLPRVNGAMRSPAIVLRFGGIVNIDEVRAFFTVPHYERSEIGSIHYSPQPPSKPGHLYIEFLYERIDDCTTIECGSLSVTYT